MLATAMRLLTISDSILYLPLGTIGAIGILPGIFGEKSNCSLSEMTVFFDFLPFFFLLAGGFGFDGDKVTAAESIASVSNLRAFSWSVEMQCNISRVTVNLRGRSFFCCSRRIVSNTP